MKNGILQKISFWCLFQSNCAFYSLRIDLDLCLGGFFFFLFLGWLPWFLAFDPFSNKRDGMEEGESVGGGGGGREAGLSASFS